nr:hypothetical protein [uncultured bacterium]
MAPRFEWDPEKADSNLARHRVSFAEAESVFTDEHSLEIPDPDHSWTEQRFILVGQSHRGRLLVVVFTERGDSIRIISARETTRHERTAYEEGR